MVPGGTVVSGLQERVDDPRQSVFRVFFALITLADMKKLLALL
ncbi:MAG: hypothetical protein ACI8WM_002148, partial [Burkholderiaceae bacterium]